MHHVTDMPVGMLPRHRSRCIVSLERPFWRFVNHDLQANFSSIGFVTVYEYVNNLCCIYITILQTVYSISTVRMGHYWAVISNNRFSNCSPNTNIRACIWSVGDKLQLNIVLVQYFPVLWSARLRNQNEKTITGVSFTASLHWSSGISMISLSTLWDYTQATKRIIDRHFKRASL
jgi:hypothetical protein